MFWLIVIGLLILAFGGFGHTGYRRGWYGGGYGYDGPRSGGWFGGGLGAFLLILLVLFLLFGGGHQYYRY